MLGRWRRARAPAALAALAEAWAAAVGPEGATRSRPVRRSRAGVVTIACADASWAQELAARADVLLARLGAVPAGERPAALRFVVADHVLSTPAPPRRDPPRRPPTPEAVDAARRAAAGVSDPELRAQLERAAAAALTPRDAARDKETPAKRGL
jgi:hypothetical protein